MLYVVLFLEKLSLHVLNEKVNTFWILWNYSCAIQLLRHKAMELFFLVE